MTSASASFAPSTRVRGAYVSLPGIGEAYAERNSMLRGEAFFGTDGAVQHGTALTLFAGSTNVVVNRHGGKTITRTWLLFAAPILAAASLARTFIRR